MEQPPEGAVAGGRPLASAGMRVLARVLDAIIVGIVFGSVFAAIILSGDDDAGLAGFGADASVGRAYVLALLGAAVGFAWDAVCTKMFGGTPMKLAFGMKVVQQNGADVEWEHAIKRWALPGAFALIPPFVALNVLLSLAQLVIVIVSLVFIFQKPLRTALWDQFAGTMVVTTR
jgi:uncharacterized RDD family membrane protein YckC